MAVFGNHEGFFNSYNDFAPTLLYHCQLLDIMIKLDRMRAGH